MLHFASAEGQQASHIGICMSCMVFGGFDIFVTRALLLWQ